eukprot:1161266-Pelagomonas_calceolata.AAC.6
MAKLCVTSTYHACNRRADVPCVLTDGTNDTQDMPRHHTIRTMGDPMPGLKSFKTGAWPKHEPSELTIRTMGDPMPGLKSFKTGAWPKHEPSELTMRTMGDPTPHESLTMGPHPCHAMKSDDAASKLM